MSRDLDNYITGHYGEDKLKHYDGYWPAPTAHQTHWEMSHNPLVYEYDPADNGPECEVITRILAAHAELENTKL
jgi:hypothetical protein